MAGPGARSRVRDMARASKSLGYIFLRIICGILKRLVAGQCCGTDSLRGDRFCGCGGADCSSTKS